MEFIWHHALLLIILVPFLASLLLFTFPKSPGGGQRQFSLVVAVVILLAAIGLSYGHYYLFPDWQLGDYLSHSQFLAVNYHADADSFTLFLLLVAAIAILLSVLLAPRRLPELRSYYALLFLGESLLFLNITAQNLIIFVASFLLGTLLGLWLGWRWLAAEYAGDLRRFVLWRLSAIFILFIGIIMLGQAASSFDVSQIAEFIADSPIEPELQKRIFAVLVSGILLLIPLYPWPLFSAVWQNTPHGFIVLRLLETLSLLHFLVGIVMPILPLGVANAAPLLALITIFSALAASALSLHEEDLRNIFWRILCAFNAFSLTAIFSLRAEGISGGLLLAFSVAAIYVGISWYHREMLPHRIPCLIDRHQGLAAQAPKTALIYAFLAAGFTVLPLFATLGSILLSFSGLWQSPLVASYITYKEIVHLATFLVLLALLVASIALVPWLLKALYNNRISRVIFVIILFLWLLLLGQFLIASPISLGLCPRLYHSFDSDDGPFGQLFNFIAILFVVGLVFQHIGVARAVIRLLTGTPSLIVQNPPMEFAEHKRLLGWFIVALLVLLGLAQSGYSRFIEELAVSVAKALGVAL